jgi:hypothetical protein
VPKINSISAGLFAAEYGGCGGGTITNLIDYSAFL